MFSTKRLRLLAKEPLPKDLAAALTSLDIRSCVGKSTKLSDIYHAAFEVLAESERSEYVFKNAIAERLLYGRHSPRTAALLFEFKAAGCKLDALLLNGEANAFEIKTSLDELRRLPAQIASYRRVFKSIWLLTDNKHLGMATTMLPPEVGIKVLSKRYRLENVRSATLCSDFLNAESILASLRKDEYLNIARATGNPIDHIPNTRQYEAASAIFQALDLGQLHDAMVVQLKQRFARVNQNLALNIPRSLAAAALSMNLSVSDAHRFVANLQRKASEIMEIA